MHCLIEIDKIKVLLFESIHVTKKKELNHLFFFVFNKVTCFFCFCKYSKMFIL